MTQYLRFIVVGGLATATHAAGLVVLVEVLGLDPTLATVLAFPIALAVSYYLNRAWTFRVGGDVARQVPKFVVGQLVGLALNATIMYVGNQLLDLHYAIAFGVCVLIVPFVVFTLQKHWTFASVGTTRA